MAAAGGNNISRYTYRGEVGEVIPWDATHLTVAEGCTAVLRGACDCWGDPEEDFVLFSIVEVICHDKVETIEENAFRKCPYLRRVIMPGVRDVGEGAFWGCSALTDVECEKLEMVGYYAFNNCKSLRSIDLSSVRIVDAEAFSDCEALLNLNFGDKLERIYDYAFSGCAALERIRIPYLKGCLIDYDTIHGCEKLKHVDLVGGVHETIAALHLDQWRNDMNEEIDSINQILPGIHDDAKLDDLDEGKAEKIKRWFRQFLMYVHGDDVEILTIKRVRDKNEVIIGWFRSVLDKIAHYQAEHQRILDEAETTLQLALPRDIVVNNVLSFLALPVHTFD